MSYTYDQQIKSFLEHSGVKGMKWGKRKSDIAPSSLVKLKTDSLTVKTAKGEVLKLEGLKTPTIARLISRLSTSYRKGINNQSHYSLKDDKGLKIGEMSLHKKTPTELNVIWVEVRTASRGKGYASAAMKAAVGIAKKEKLKTVTLEVPGASPDAKHIYEKMGFKSTGQVTPKNDIWGGLTAMQLDLKSNSLSHQEMNNMSDASYDEQIGDFLAHSGVLGMKWGKHNSTSSMNKKKLTRKEVRTEKNEFYQNKAKRLIEKSLKDPNILIALNSGQTIPSIVSGREFVNHLSNGGLLNIKMTDVYAQQKNKAGAYILNDNPNQSYRRSDK